MATDDAGSAGNTLGSRIRALREAEGWTQSELARRAKVEQSTIQNVETGRVKRPSTLPHIADALGVSIEDLTGEAGPPPAAGIDRDKLRELLRQNRRIGDELERLINDNP